MNIDELLEKAKSNSLSIPCDISTNYSGTKILSENCSVCPHCGDVDYEYYDQIHPGIGCPSSIQMHCYNCSNDYSVEVEYSCTLIVSPIT